MRRFDSQITRLNDMLIEMGALVEAAIASSINALVTQNKDKAKRTIELDADIDQMEKDIEALCLRLLLQQHPVAGDLRLISAALKMITDMERIGDQSADIAEISFFMSGQKFIKKLEHIPEMAGAAIKMVTGSIDAFVKKDLALARAVVEDDDIVDELFNTVKRELIELVKTGDGSNAEQAIDLMMIAKYLERIGDHAVNIAEWAAFSITGRHESDERERLGKVDA